MTRRRRELVSENVLRIEYEHVDDPEEYSRVHEFEPGCKMYALDDGTVLLERDGEVLWQEFEDPEEDE